MASRKAGKATMLVAIMIQALDILFFENLSDKIPDTIAAIGEQIIIMAANMTENYAVFYGNLRRK